MTDQNAAFPSPHRPIAPHSALCTPHSGTRRSSPPLRRTRLCDPSIVHPRALPRRAARAAGCALADGTAVARRGAARAAPARARGAHLPRDGLVEA